MAEAVGLTASCIAIVELSAKIAGWCLQYRTTVKTAAADIERLQRQVQALEATVHGFRKLLEGTRGASFPVAKQLQCAIDDCRGQLVGLENELKPGKRQTAMSRFGLRALKWPFKSQDVDKLIGDIQSWMDIVNLGLQVDQR